MLSYATTSIRKRQSSAQCVPEAATMRDVRMLFDKLLCKFPPPSSTIQPQEPFPKKVVRVAAEAQPKQVLVYRM